MKVLDKEQFKIYRRRYADLLIRFGLNVVEGQVVNISAETTHEDFVLEIVDAAYNAGAKFVNVDLVDPRVLKSRLLNSKDEDLSFVPSFITNKYTSMVDETSANLKIIGSEYPEILADLDPKRINKVRLSQHLAIKYFYDEGIGKSKVHWTVAAAATEGWAKKLFPNLEPSEGCIKLWDHLFKICRVDTEDYLDRWKKHDESLHQRALMLNSLKIESVKFTGPETDLEVFLTRHSKFKGGSDISPREVPFEPNVPTEEVFTTPDARKTRGHVRTTRPFLVNGTLIKDLRLEFENGVIKQFSAEQGEDTFREYISSDDGAKRLGELALVGIDSPIYKSGIIFEEILLDENAACHIAIGSAYKFCVEGGGSMNKDQLKEIGCNESSVHTDMMISSEHVDVVATTFDGKVFSLIEKGKWVV